MKSKRTSWYVTALTALSLATLTHTTYSGQAVVGINPPTLPANSANSLLVNNQPLNVELLSTVSQGLLTVVSENPVNGKRAQVPFRIYVKRDGELVANSAHAADQSVTEIDLKDVLMVAQPGDWLIIEPVRAEDRVPRHTLLLKSPMYSWLLFPRRDGC